jgi:2-dehydro-3-deoxyglucarate aldolase/4-hydroxy-2-oxoheptanedioate aldolase
MSFKKYFEKANKSVVIILQIEHIEAVNQIEAISNVSGIDALFIGPYDLSGSMGKPGRVSDPDVKREIEKVRDICKEKDLPMGIFTVDAAEVDHLRSQGYQLITLGLDIMFLGKAVQESLKVAGLR